MPPIIIQERRHKIAGFEIGRFLPDIKKRTVGPFILIDHSAPPVNGKSDEITVDQHPHIGMATISYLLKGEVMHADSMGNVKRLGPRAVNLMISGKGLTHTERTPEDLKGSDFEMELYQIWLGITKEMEDMEPEFHHLQESEVPEWEELGVEYRLVAGSIQGRKSKLKTWLGMFFIEINFHETKLSDLSNQLVGEKGIMVSKGTISYKGEEHGKGELIVLSEEEPCVFKGEEGARVILFGGEQLTEKRFMDWNFVSTDLEKIKKAKEDWKNKRFPEVPNDDTYISYPELKK
jgi:redox-sensitive bicupin YhaK (pirin superfamily)